MPFSRGIGKTGTMWTMGLSGNPVVFQGKGIVHRFGNSGNMTAGKTGIKAKTTVCVVSGADEFLTQQRIHELTAQAHGLIPEADLMELDAGSAQPYEFDEAVSPSLLSTASLVLIAHAENMSQALADSVEAYIKQSKEAAGQEPESLVIIEHNGSPKGTGIIRQLERAGAQVDKIESLKTPKARANFIVSLFEKRNRRIAPPAAQFIADVLGDKTGEMASLCDQLCDDFPDNPMPVSIVRTYLSANPQVTGFAVAQAALQGRLAQAVVDMRSAVQQGQDPLALVGAIAMKIRSMAKASAVDQGKLTQAEAKMSPWQLRAVRQEVRGWTSSGLSRCIQMAAWVDEQCKSSGSDPLYALEKLLAALAAKGEVPLPVGEDFGDLEDFGGKLTGVGGYGIGKYGNGGNGKQDAKLDTIQRLPAEGCRLSFRGVGFNQCSLT